MHANLKSSLIALLGACFLALVNAQTTSNVPPGNAATFHEPARLASAPQPPPTLREIGAELSGSLIGQAPNMAIEFVLTLQNNGQQEVEIRDPLDSLFLEVSTATNKPIALPRRVPKALIDSGVPKGRVPGESRAVSYPAPVQFRQTTTATGVTSQKEETITMPPGGKVQIVFESEPVVMEKVIEAVQDEKGEAATSFNVRAIMALISAPPITQSRSLDSDWIVFMLSPHTK
jgi:hypothetical protein